MGVDHYPRHRAPASIALRALLTLALFSVFDRGASGQAVGANVGGVVTDETGGRLPGVTITITNKLNGAVQLLVTGDQGNYRAVALHPAPYDVKAELSGFAPQMRVLTLTVGADATLDFRLTVAGLQESLMVAAESPLVEVAKSQPSASVVSAQVDTLPVLQRNFLALAQLLPGSGPDNSTSQKYSVAKFGGPADQRNGFTTMIDGGVLDDEIWGNPTINMTQDAVQEFKVFRNQFDAEYGSALAAAVAVVTKSGTNELSGSAFYFGRDRALNARNRFAVTKPAFSQQREGGSIGGPIAKDKTHFFGAFEYNSTKTVNIIALSPVNPFAAQENGVFPSPYRNYLVDAKVDHRMNASHSLFVRYAYDNQYAQRTGAVSSDSNNANDYSKAHSLVAEDNLILSQKTVNTFRFHLLRQDQGTDPRSFDVSISRPSVTTGQATSLPQYFPRTNVTLSDTLYFNSASHNLKFGGDFLHGSYDFDAHFFEHGQFLFATDKPFDATNSATWPISFTQQKPGFEHYVSNHVSAYVQDDWRLTSHVRLNVGLRYDLDTNLKLKEFYAPLLADPTYAGVGRFVSATGSNDYFSFQPRLGATWDVRGDGHLVFSGGWGIYTARNRPWFQERTMNQLTSSAVRIENPQQLRFFPEINAVLGGKTLDQYVATGGARLLGTVVPDNYVLPRSQNTTVGVGWQINGFTSFNANYAHDYADRQFGFTDVNLPASGPISTSNPRPVPQFSQVLVLQNFTKSWYDALETQLRTRVRGANSLQVSYTLSRSYIDGVDFFNLTRGTQRTPDSRGYNPIDQRHNLSAAGSSTLPGNVEVSGIVKALSGAPYRVQAGFDIDGDGSITGDRPPGLPYTAGRDDVVQELQVINNLRASRGLPPISGDLLKLNPYLSIDMRITKVIPLSNRRLKLFIEGYNLTNHVNYQAFSVNMNIISPSFLIRNSAGDARQFQWGVRYEF